MIYDPSSHEQDRPVLHRITITATIPMLTTAQAAVDRDALLELLTAHPEYIEKVTCILAVPDESPGPRWRHPDTGLTEEQDTERGY